LTDFIKKDVVKHPQANKIKPFIIYENQNGKNKKIRAENFTFK